VHAGGVDVAQESLRGFENDTDSAAVFDKDFANGRFRADFDASFSCGIGDGVRNGAGTAARADPGAESTVAFAQVVMEKNVGGARRTDPEKCADDAGSGHGGFKNVGF